MLDHAAGGAIGRSVPQAAESDMKRDRCQSHRCSRIYTKRIPASPCFLAWLLDYFLSFNLIESRKALASAASLASPGAALFS